MKKLKVESWNIATKMKMNPCPRCGDKYPRVYVKDDKDPFGRCVWYVACGEFYGNCGLRTNGWFSMKMAVYQWNGVFLRRAEKERKNEQRTIK